MGAGEDRRRKMISTKLHPYMFAAIFFGNRFVQRFDPFDVGILRHSVTERFDGRGLNMFGRIEIGFTRGKIDHVDTGSAQLAGFGGNRKRYRGFDQFCPIGELGHVDHRGLQTRGNFGRLAIAARALPAQHLHQLFRRFDANIRRDQAFFHRFKRLFVPTAILKNRADILQ